MHHRSFDAKTLFALTVLLGSLAAPTFAAQTAAKSSPKPSAARRDIVGTEKKVYSRAMEEVIIRDFFQDRREGVFLDVGCWQPIEASNTYYLERELGWTGVAIDALAELAPKWKRARPKAKFLNFLVADKVGPPAPFYRAAFTDISSKEKPTTGPAGNPVASTAVLVATTTLTKALDDNGIKKIDFMSMDIEGSEIPALKGFDIDRFQPKLICIETKVKNRDEILAYFKAHGYRRLDEYTKYDQTNWYFAPIAAR